MPPAASRRGLTLVELLVAVGITLVVSAAVLPVIIRQNDFGARVEAARGARSVTRAGVNAIFSDLRMVEAAGGIVAASATSITARVPYAMGVVCAVHGSRVTVSLQPVDSVMYSAPGYSGFAWRDASGTYQYTATSTPPVAGNAGDCAGASPVIETIPGGRVIEVGGLSGPAPVTGMLLVLYRVVRYSISSSTSVPGQLGLFRTLVATGATEELSAPFASGSRFRFFVLSATTAQDAVPGSLSDLRGIEVRLTGASERTVRGRAGPELAPYRTAVFFRNRLD